MGVAQQLKCWGQLLLILEVRTACSSCPFDSQHQCSTWKAQYCRDLLRLLDWVTYSWSNNRCLMTLCCPTTPKTHWNSKIMMGPQSDTLGPSAHFLSESQSNRAEPHERAWMVIPLWLQIVPQCLLFHPLETCQSWAILVILFMCHVRVEMSMMGVWSTLIAFLLGPRIGFSLIPLRLLEYFSEWKLNKYVLVAPQKGAYIYDIDFVGRILIWNTSCWYRRHPHTCTFLWWFWTGSQMEGWGHPISCGSDEQGEGVELVGKLYLAASAGGLQEWNPCHGVAINASSRLPTHHLGPLPLNRTKHAKRT